MDNVYKNFGSVVKQYRLLKDLSTQELAEILNISTGLVNNIEHGKTDTFNFELLYKISEVLEIPLLKLILGDSVALKGAHPDLVDELLELYETNKLEDEVQFIKSNLLRIIESYLSTIATFEYKELVIKEITDKILYELEYIKKLKM